MSPAHTPGPWFADAAGSIWRREPSELYQNGGGVAGDCPVAVAELGQASWENKFPARANARLIAAAPELLEALQAMVESYQHEASMSNPALLTARAAIAKATQP